MYGALVKRNELMRLLGVKKAAGFPASGSHVRQPGQPLLGVLDFGQAGVGSLPFDPSIPL